MNLKQTLKIFISGFCFGMGLTWLLAIILSATMGADGIKFIQECSEDIFSFSLFMGGGSSIIWLILSASGRKRKKREELEDAMTEYFRNKNKENNE